MWMTETLRAVEAVRTTLDTSVLRCFRTNETALATRHCMGLSCCFEHIWTNVIPGFCICSLLYSMQTRQMLVLTKLCACSRTQQLIMIGILSRVGTTGRRFSTTVVRMAPGNSTSNSCTVSSTLSNFKSWETKPHLPSHNTAARSPQDPRSSGTVSACGKV